MKLLKEKIIVCVKRDVISKTERLGSVGITSTKGLSSEYWRTKMMSEEESMGLWRKQQRQPEQAPVGSQKSSLPY